MKLAPLLIPFIATAATANLAGNALSWAGQLVSGGRDALAVADGPIKTMDSWSYVDCGLATDAVQIKSITVSPDPPVPGKNLTVNVKADVLTTIEEGAYADVTVKLGLIKLLHKEFDLCDEARNANATVQCPVKPGPYSVSQMVELPEEIPKAKFAVLVRGFTVEDEDMLCLDLFVDFMKK
ncbi:phosphatidylglycerol/phosphatidylinositol transfer protein [Cryptococcus gattii E566]|uniref:Phosphatidylglycerol/phosphatidylinositol transfer protein n=2 Tax=Cryptococcus gattii TaxID=37769 RepID=E6R3W8_CRYGW|nr:Vacuole protein, putative [Cryptococcus gattii WM276]KAE8538693.1 phosphatidylglycerol/phosphatidylinositol transfer protein [Cryptococcus gattii VGV]KIR80689.1 phosphatidylglycerol/phosphatidylinositol transfer protein [Cryptococcus gattii EJB2]KIY35547.1 phosphatidylglycerol/phosphatidylinositol transfer protein [Cryptococcus gattii E566]KJE04395.1 phosphatidylglycerol/phosphatidylinositol transfer protein [Cryptococcus gattii NT-10]ADV21812.1 Vacuole protein, putative [Cryptococcus gatti